MDKIPCWNCPPEAGNVMKRYGEDSFYSYYECPTCRMKKAQMKEKEDGRKTGDDE